MNHVFSRGLFNLKLKTSYGINQICNKTATITNSAPRFARSISSKNQELTMSELETYVQLLPVILPSTSASQGKILLCKWSSGVFQDRYTGIIKNLGNIPKNATDPNSTDLKSKLALVAKDLLPLPLQTSLKKVELVGVLRFDGPPESDQYIYLATFNSDAKKPASKEAIMIDEKHPCFWFDWDKIPFDKMPADDPIWYPKVLGEGKKIKGSFVFGGWSERTIKSYELSIVDNL